MDQNFKLRPSFVFLFVNEFLSESAVFREVVNKEMSEPMFIFTLPKGTFSAGV